MIWEHKVYTIVMLTREEEREVVCFNSLIYSLYSSHSIFDMIPSILTIAAEM